MSNIIIVGYGQMGKLIESFCPKHSLNVVKTVDPLKGSHLENTDLEDIDLAFEFTQPDSVMKNLKFLLENNIKVVTGTTGWYKHIPEIKAIVKANNGSFLYGSNFSIGMNLFYHILEYSAKLIGKNPEYDCWGLEKHHNRKMDSPSGTAKILSNIIINSFPGKTEPQFEKLDRKIRPEEFHLASIRSGNIPGEHTIGFDSEADSIEISHNARNRNGLALGAIKAGLWLLDHKGFYNFKDIFTQIIEKP